jgi:phage gpG-like protein
MTIQIIGGDKIMRKLSNEVMRQPMRRFFTKAAIAVQSGAKERAPVDTGRLRSSLTFQVDAAALPLWAKVGSNVSYAPFMEHGTGVLSENPQATKRWHFPAASHLEVWARRKRLDAFQVAKAIRERGGLKPRRFLRGSFEANQGKIKGYLRQAETEIQQEWLS